MELTRTNRSGGLTTYISRREGSRSRDRRHAAPHAAVRGAPGEGPGRHIQSSPTHSNACRELVEWTLQSNDHHHRAPAALQRRSRPPAPAGRASHFVFPGDNTGEVTPVPIPNTEVKLSRADGTAGATLWESRTSPGF